MARYTPQQLADIENSIDLVELIRRYVPLVQKGRYWVGHCPNHHDENASFKINTSLRVWRCHSACGDDFSGKGAINWMMHGTPKLPFLEAVEQLTTGAIIAECKPHVNSVLPKQKAEALVAIMPIPADALKSRPDGFKGKLPNKVTVALDEKGQPLYYEYRFNVLNEDGSPKIKESTGKADKYFHPLCWTERGWQWQAPQSPRPLMGLDRIGAKPNSHVAVFEGYKCAEFAQPLTDKACISWQGGGNAVYQTDWTPLKGKRVYLCRDHDNPGWKTMEWLGTHLQSLGCRVMWCVNPSGWTKGMDVADTGWDQSMMTAYFKGAVAFAERGENPHSEAPKPKPAKALDSPQEADLSPRLDGDESPPPNPWMTGNEPFIHLGYSREGKNGRAYYYYVKAQFMLFSMSPSGMNEPGFLQLAPFEWWAGNFKLRQGRIDRVAMANMLIQAGTMVGMFDPTKRRGRGVWMDRGRIVIHAGDRLIVDGKTRDLDIDSEFIYEQKTRVVGNLPKPMKLEEAHKYLELCKMMSWEAPVMAHLLAGWVTIAPLCGILPWRPHFWIVGPSGSGKSTILRWLAHAMLGDFHLYATGGTTEPGIRAGMGDDGLPVLLEEMEGNSNVARANVQKIMELVRGMSSNNSGSILKGGAGGSEGTNTTLRSMFMFVSIQSAVDASADKRRTTVAVLKKSTTAAAAKEWSETIEPAIEALVTPKYVAAFQSRTFAMAPTILANSKVFGAAVAAHLGSQPLGDQLGPLLAGAYSLASNNIVTTETAARIVAAHEWMAEKAITAAKDETALLDVILSQKIKFTNNGTPTERTAAQLVAMAAHPSDSYFIRADEIRQALEQNGMLVKSDSLYIVCDSEWLRTVLREGRQWSFSGIDQLLSRITGAIPCKEAVVVASKQCRKVVRIPLSSCGIVAPDGAQMDLFARQPEDDETYKAPF